MRPFSASSAERFAWQFSLAFRLVLLTLAIALLHSSPIVAQSTMVPVPTRPRVITKPLRSVVELMRGEQSVRTRRVVGFRKVHVRAQDEIWLVSARNGEQCELTSRKLVNGQWIAASITELAQSHAKDKQKTSLVYVHGNRTDEVFASSRGLQFYENLFNGQMCSGPIRFVIFAWHSEREICGPAADYRIKLDRSVALGSTFANFLNQFEDRRLLLAGFSLGGQIILSSLAQLECQMASDPNPKQGSFRVALITPALEANDALNSVGPLPTNPLVSQTVVFINRRDIAIRAASFATRKTSAPPAVTLEQVSQQPVCGTTNPVVIEDLTCKVSSFHSITRYSARSEKLQSVINQMSNDLRSSAGPVSPQYLISPPCVVMPQCVVLPQCCPGPMSPIVEEIQPRIATP